MDGTRNLSEVIELTAAHLQQKLAGESSGHDWWHIDRVRRTAVTLARAEGADLRVVELAALLHDIADWKFRDGDETAGPKAARGWLSSQGVDPALIDTVCEIIATVSFKGAGVPTEMSSIEGKCVQDADRLDAIGAIGIARTFAFGGHFHQPMYEPDISPELHASFEAYRKKRTSTINHFYEKLLLLKDRMQTDSGRAMAAQRHEFMVAYLKQFFEEWG